MSVRLISVTAALGLVATLGACSADSSLAPSAAKGADNLPGDVRGLGGKRNDDVKPNPAKGQGGGQVQAGDDRGRGGKGADDGANHP